jgi:hypothetical protein
VVDEDSRHPRWIRYVLYDRDSRFCASFEAILKTAGVKCVELPPQSPNLNAVASDGFAR